MPLLTTLRPAWVQWARDFGPDGILEDVWDADGIPRPERLDELFEDQGVDVALLFCECSPNVTGTQTFDDLLPIVEHNPARFRPMANVNPHLHLSIAVEVERQRRSSCEAQGAEKRQWTQWSDIAATVPAAIRQKGVSILIPQTGAGPQVRQGSSGRPTSRLGGSCRAPRAGCGAGRVRPALRNDR